MTQPTNKQVTPLTEFVDSVFVELEALQLEYSSEVSPSYDSSKRKWKDTLIPLAVRIYELAQKDDGICWWLLQKMSHIELCKEGAEFRKTDLFEVLTELKQDPNRLRMILRNCQLNDAEELQQAIEKDDIDGFRKKLNQTDGLVFAVGRVLRRFMAIREIYERTVAEEGIETLAALFWLIRRLLLYFPVDRPCDAMAYNFLVALNISMYSDDESDFCELLTKTGGLWLGSLMLDSIKNKDQMPQAISQAMYEILHDRYPYGYDRLKKAYKYCDTDEQKASLMEKYGGCLEIEKYKFIYSVLESGPFFLPPFDWKKWRPGGVRYWKNSAEEYCYHIVDPLLKDWLTMEELEALKAQVVNTSVAGQESVAVYDCDPKPAAEVKRHGVKSKSEKTQRELEPMWFPTNIDINPDQCKRFLEILHSKLCTSKFLMEDSKCDFVFIFGGMNDGGSHHPVDWQNNDKATLKAFCSAFYDMPKMRGRKPWSKLSLLFTFKGEPIKKLSENANEVYGKDLEVRMKRLIVSALDDLEKEI